MGEAAASDFVMDVLRLAAEYDMCGDLWWRCDGEYAPVTFFVNCNDCFYWACSDCEQLTPENLPILVQAFKDAEAADEKRGTIYAPELFVARVRGMRPQGASYKECYPETMWPLFDACGPERTDPDGRASRRKSPHQIAGELAAVATVISLPKPSFLSKVWNSIKRRFQ